MTSTLLPDHTRQELRQALGQHVANHLLEAVDQLDSRMSGGAVTDITFLKQEVRKFSASTDALVDSHVKLQRQIDELKADVAGSQKQFADFVADFRNFGDVPTEVSPPAAGLPVSPPVDLTDLDPEP